MSHWNYRVVKTKRVCGPRREEEICYGIHEVFYNDKGDPVSCTEHPVGIVSESAEHFEWIFKLMNKALEKPILDKEEFAK